MTAQVGKRGHMGQDETWILRSDQLRCLVSAVRLDIVDHLAARGPMAIRELANEIGRRPSALYHHIDQLLAVELVVESGMRIVNRKQEKLYATPSRRMRLKRALSMPENKEVMSEIVSALARQADRDFSVGQDRKDSNAEGHFRNLGFFRLVAKPGPERLARINSLLEEIGELMWEDADEDAGTVTLTWIMAPGE